ncbi:hypothetical protein TSUD_388770, partial [Trifolium subterraneum]
MDSLLKCFRLCLKVYIEIMQLISGMISTRRLPIEINLHGRVAERFVCSNKLALQSQLYFHDNGHQEQSHLQMICLANACTNLAVHQSYTFSYLQHTTEDQTHALIIRGTY